MKIGIITYHYGYNEGTLLQAYAVQELLDAAFGLGSAEIVDHRYPGKEPVVFAPPTTPREQALRSFFDQSLRLSRFQNRSSKDAETWKHVSQNYRCLVVGSDELWRLDYSQKRRFFWTEYRQDNVWAPAFPNVYWPNAAELGIPCVSLAASISEKDLIREIPLNHRRQLQSALRNFSLITVRDSRTQAFVEGLIGREGPECQWLPDPTFALDAPTRETLASVERMLLDAGVDLQRKNALFISTAPSPSLVRVAEFFKRADYHTTSLSYRLPGMDHDLSACSIGPMEWAAISRFFDVVATDRFHGAVFALRNSVPVVALDYRGQLSGNDSKMLDLFKRFGLESYWHSVKTENLAGLDEILWRIREGNWPKERVHKTSEDFRQILKEFVAGPLAKVAGKQSRADAKIPGE